jgi:hypothetical protein
MIDATTGTFYLSYGALCFALLVTYIRVKSAEGITITTREFKGFQTSFLTGYSAMILCELICTASFYQTYVALKFSLEQVTKLYVVTIASTTACGMLVEVVDVGSRKDKCVLSGILYSVAMLTVFLGGHFDIVLLGRVVYGAASALHHSSFEAYVIQEHASLGFPDDWLTQTFTFLTHSMSLVAALSGTVGQVATSSGGPLGCAALCCALFALTSVYLVAAWGKDMGSPKFMLSGFLFNVRQTVQAVKINRQMALLMGISSLCEASITVFTFYWAPWITFMVPEEARAAVPYPIVFATYIAASMLGNYLYQMYSSQGGGSGGGGSNGASVDGIFQAILFASSLAFFLGAAFQTPTMAFGISVVVQMCVGGYWPSVGYLRGRYVLPELRATFLTLSRMVTLVIAVAVLTVAHHNPMLTLGACAVLNGAAAWLQHVITHTDTTRGLPTIDEDEADH